MRQLRPNASAPVPSNFRVVQGQICSIQRVHKDDGAIVILSDLTRDIGNIELEKDGNEHQDWAREGCGLMLDCACVLYLCTIFPCLGPNHCVLRPSHLDLAFLSLLASLCALPSSLLGADPFCTIPPFWDRTIASFYPLISIVRVSLFSLPSAFFPLRS